MYDIISPQVECIDGFRHRRLCLLGSSIRVINCIVIQSEYSVLIMYKLIHNTAI